GVALRFAMPCSTASAGVAPASGETKSRRGFVSMPPLTAARARPAKSTAPAEAETRITTAARRARMLVGGGPYPAQKMGTGYFSCRGRYELLARSDRGLLHLRRLVP